MDPFRGPSGINPRLKGDLSKMKKVLAWMMCLALALTATAALGEAPAADPLHADLAKLAETPYTLATTEYGEMTPTDPNQTEIFVELLNDMTFEPTTAEAPDGEYVVLAFPGENIRYDFFLGDVQENLFRLVKADGTEEMFKATVPEGRAEIGNVMDAWASSVADTLGLVPSVEAKMPDPGWILDSVEGKVWVDDRASLEVFLEDTENYKVLISWSSSAFEATEWTYACEYKAEDQTLNALHMIQEEVVYDEQGEETRKTLEDKDVQTVFALNADGKVVITGAEDDQLEGKTFEAAPVVLPDSAWTAPESNAVTDELKAAFDKAMETLLGVNYTPLAYLGSKDGTNCFFCRAEAVVPSPVPYYTLVYTNDSGVQNIYEVWIDAHAE